MKTPLNPFAGKIYFCLVFLLLPFLSFSQSCEESLVWKDYVADQLPDDVSYSTIMPNPLNMGKQSFNIFNTAPTGGASILNGTIRDEFLGGVSESYVLSLNGDPGDEIKFKLEFIQPVSKVFFNILDIDRHSNGFWQDSVVLSVYSEGTKLDLDPSYILFQGTAVDFVPTTDALIGKSTVNNPVGTAGNVNFYFPEIIDSIMITYGYGFESNSGELGNQLVGIDIVHFTSTVSCDDPHVIEDFVCSSLGDDLITIDALSNDQEGDFGYDFSTFRIMHSPSNGTATINANNIIEYIPNTDFKGKDELRYEICDLNGTCVDALVEIIVKGDASIFAMNDDVVLLSNTSASTNVLVNDFDIEYGILAVDQSAIIPPTNGTLTIASDGTLNYTPNANFSGIDKASYTICRTDSPSKCDVAEVFFHVQSVILGTEKSFIDISDEIYMYAGNAMYHDVSRNLAQLPGTSGNYDYEISQNPINGTVTITEDGMMRYVGDFGFVGEDELEYKVTDLNTGKVTFVLTRVHIMDDYMSCNEDIAIPSSDFGYMYEDGSFSGNVADNDFQGMPLAYTVNTTPVVDPTNGAVVLNSDGTYTYTPNPGYFGSDEFSYEICYRASSLTEYPHDQVAQSLPFVVSNGVASSSNVLTISEPGKVAGISLSHLEIAHNNISDITVRLESPSGLSAIVFQNVCEGYENMVLNFSDNAIQSTLPCPATNNGLYKPKESFSKFIGEDIQGDWKLVVTDMRTQTNATTVLNWQIEAMVEGNEPIDCRIANAELLVMPNAEAPVAEDDCFELINLDQVHLLDVLANDTDHNNDIDPFSLRLLSTPQFGAATVLSNGGLYVNVHDDFEGVQTFDYEICDTLGLCSTATIKLLSASSLAVDFYDLELTLDRDNTPYLAWTVNDDHTAFSFEIERAVGNSLDFAYIGTVEADRDENQYGYFDTQLRDKSSVVYYRIKANDIDGTIKYTKIVSVNFEEELGVKIFPNPFTEFINIQINNEENQARHFELYSATGQLISKNTFYSNSFELKLNELNLPTGQYNYILKGTELLDSGVLIKR